MHEHPNEFTRRILLKYFRDRSIEVSVTAIRNGYVIFFPHFSAMEACTLHDPAGKLIYDRRRDEWELHWISGNLQWHLFDCYAKLHQALDVMYGDTAPNLFHKVL